MIETRLRIALMALAVCVGGCAGQQQTDAYIGRSVAEYAAVHGAPASAVMLSDRESMFRWDTIEDSLGQAIGSGVIVATAQPPVPALCTVRLTATTRSPNPELKDWTIQSTNRQGPC